MSVDEDTVKTGIPQASSASCLQPLDCPGGDIPVMVEGATATPDFVAACPVPGTAASPKHTSTTDVLGHSDSTSQTARENELNIGLRNTFNNPRQQQQQNKLAKRRNTASSSFKHPSSGKRRRRANSESDSVLPTNFLLGGNIFDPLNLNSLLDEDVNRALNAETPKSSPLPAKSRDPVEILIPRDITDPLNLNSGIAGSSFLGSSYKSGGRKRHRNRHHGGAAGTGTGAGTVGSSFNTQISLSDSGRAEVKGGGCSQLPGMSASCSALDVSKESDSFSSVTRESVDNSTDNSSGCREEGSSVSMDDSASLIAGGPNHHVSRRKRRRNSGKSDTPVTHSTPIGKSGPGDKSFGAGGHRYSQLFQTPRNSCKTVSAGRQHHHHHPTKEQQKKFQYGNYNKYYGYRNPGATEDPRVRLFRPEWFEGKEVLDLGCNSGHLTLYVAKMLRPARILGLDIDGGLIHAARKNIRHYLSELQTQVSRRAEQEKKSSEQEERNGKDNQTGPEEEEEEEQRRETEGENGKAVKGESGLAVDGNDNDNHSCHTDEAETQRQNSKMEEMEQEDCDSGTADHSESCSFPMSLRISRGPIAAPPLPETFSARPGEFPSNVSFIKTNYVLDNDDLLLTQRQEYDVILCMSVTKWVHLNWGDGGLKRFFRRAYKHLRPGGMFILEPQPWKSYLRRRKLTDNISRNYNSIRLKPEEFPSFLTTEVGFTSVEYLGAPKCSIGGFQRPIYVFHK